MVENKVFKNNILSKAMFILDATQFKPKSNSRNKKEYFIMLRGTPSRITNLSLYLPNKELQNT